MSRTTAFDVSAHGAERAEKEALRLLPLCQESSETVSSCGDAEEVSLLKVALIYHLLVGPKRVVVAYLECLLEELDLRLRP